MDHAATRRVTLRLFTLAFALCALVLVVDGQRWLLQRTAAQSVEYAAATCAVDALYGEPHSVAALACTTPENPSGKSL
ncbi:MAG: hypothetical protein ABI881_16710 [Betaproteobacteria bacterium]